MDLYYECMACKRYERTAASLNKHINECTEYNNFIKTYKPSNYFLCSNCGIKFISKDNLKSHSCNGYK